MAAGIEHFPAALTSAVGVKDAARPMWMPSLSNVRDVGMSVQVLAGAELLFLGKLLQF